jgi:hypothetical protein
MKRAIYRLPSTFTYIGRHASELKFLLARAKRKNEILNIGPGPFEPFYISKLSPDSRVSVVDINPKMLQMIQSNADGVRLPLREAASFCHNIQNDGSPRKNSDLLVPERIKQGRQELEIAGLDPNDFLSDGDFLYRGRSNILAMEPMDISKAAPWNQFDVVFEGLVLLNLSKVINKQELEKTIRTLGALAKKDGLLGIGTTPAGISGEKRYIHALIEALRGRFRLSELIVDNLVDGGSRGLAGGYLATFSDQWNSPIFFGDIHAAMMREPLLKDARLIDPVVNETSFLSLLNDPKYLLLAATHNGGSLYNTLFVEMASISISKERYQFRAMASLK